MTSTLGAMYVLPHDIIRVDDAWHVVRNVITSQDGRSVHLMWRDADGDMDGCTFALLADVDRLA